VTTALADYARAARTLSRLLAAQPHLDAAVASLAPAATTTGAAAHAAAVAARDALSTALAHAERECAALAASCPGGRPPGPGSRCASCSARLADHAPADGHPFAPRPQGRPSLASRSPDAMLLARVIARGLYRTRQGVARALAARLDRSPDAAQKMLSRACAAPSSTAWYPLPAEARAALEGWAAGRE
jgi:hypothetical protein